MRSRPWDVLVIGAGAAGLTCMREFRRAGLRALCLEARERIGGRIHTVHDNGAVELGAEFVHGCPREVLDLVPVAEFGGRMVKVFDGHVMEGDEGGPVLDDVKRLASPDRDESLSAFLARSSYSREQQEEAVGYAEGFNAARKEELSVASLAKDMLAADRIEGDRAFRVPAGYETVVSALGLEDVRLSCLVEAVEWKPGEVRVHLDSGEDLRALRVVVTVPLGVLQAGTIHFAPEPTAIFAAVRALRFGQAVRVTLRFERAFWEDDSRFADLGFLITDAPVFPVWWSRLPLHDATLTGWSAGPKADQLLGLEAQEVTSRALASLERILGRNASPVTGSWFHDWHADRFARGAYSWVPAGALPARDTLARPVADTLYFAGEATDLLGYGGTVHGAIASGLRAAKQILG